MTYNDRKKQHGFIRSSLQGVLARGWMENKAFEEEVGEIEEDTFEKNKKEK